MKHFYFSLVLLLSTQFFVTAQNTSSFIFKLGSDTIAFEQYTRTTNSVEGRILTLTPRGTVTRFKFEIANGKTITNFTSFNYSVLTPERISSERTVNIRDTLIDQQFKRAGKIDSLFSGSYAALPGAIPHLDYDAFIYEQMLMQLSASGKDSLPLSRLTNTAMGSYIKKNTANVFESKYFFFPVIAKTDQAGKVITVDATASTIKTIGQRIPNFDFDATVSRYADNEKAKGPMGSVSPNDTIKATFKQADFTITYGRPSKRERTVFGNIVPYEVVWRTGANFATHFATTKDLDFGGTIVPAGRYTLWTLPSQTTTKLIINNAVNIFGTQYNPSKDLVRLNMKTEKLSSVVEKFTIQCIENNEGGELKFQWDQTQFSIPFKVK